MLLTKEIKELIRTANSVCFDFTQVVNAQSFESDKCDVTIRIGQENRRANTESRHLFEGFEGWIRGGYKSATTLHPRHGSFPERLDYSHEESNWYKPTKGTIVMLTASHDDHLQSVFRAIPSGSKLKFVLALDWATHEGMVRAGLHGDIFSVEAQPPTPKNTRKQPRPMTFTVETEIHSHNTARFGHPGSMFY